MARLELGGYLPLENFLPAEKPQSLHADAVALNSGRNALRYLLLDTSFDRIYLPSYICGAVSDLLIDMATPIELYRTSPALEPLPEDLHPGPNDCVIVVNYFGVMSATVKELVARLPNTIVDNTQAFYCECHGSIGSFFSPRKFCGVPDGGYAYCAENKIASLEQDDSTGRLAHLTMRRTSGAAAGYQAYLENEARLATLGMRGMSEYTSGILEQLDYAAIARVRTANFRALHSELTHLNQLELDLDAIYGPMAYPLLLQDAANLRQRLIERSIFIPRYWPDMPASNSDCSAHHLADNLLPLPVDQNIEARELDYLLENLRELL